MQLVGQGLHVIRNPSCLFLQFLHTAADFYGQLRIVLSKLLKIDSQHCKTLAYIVVQFSRNACAFLLLRLNEFPAHAGKSLLGDFVISDVDARAYVASKRAIFMKPWHPDVKHPAIVSIVSSQTAFFPKRLPLIEPPTINIMTLLVVVRMNYSGQAIQKVGFREAGEVQPRPIEISGLFVQS